jgi:hypothetical protein
VWLRRALRFDTSGPSGKFNAGQKVNSAFVLGATIVMFVTGLMLHFFAPLPDNVRTGATFVHDLFALAIVRHGGWAHLDGVERPRGPLGAENRFRESRVGRAEAPAVGRTCQYRARFW